MNYIWGTGLGKMNKPFSAHPGLLLKIYQEVVDPYDENPQIGG